MCVEVVHVAKRICELKDLNENGKNIYWILYMLHDSEDQTTYEKNAKQLWEYLPFNDKSFNCIKIKAVLIKTVKKLFEAKSNIDSKINQSNALYHDIALIMFNLLKTECYYLKSNVKQENLTSYKIRIRIYLNEKAFVRHAFEQFDYSKRPARVIASIANFLSEQEDVAVYLQNALCEYTRPDSNGVYNLIFQKPYLTPENFPSLNQYNIPKPETVYKIPVRADFYYDDGSEPISVQINSGEEARKQASSSIQNYELNSSEGSINTLPALGMPAERQYLFAQKDTEKLSFVKSNYKLLNNVRVKKILNVFCKISRNCIQPAYLALTIMTNFFNPNYELFQQLNQFNIATAQNAYNEVNPHFTVKAQARTGWGKDTIPSIGDKVEFQIEYRNLSDTTHNQVVIDADLPANLRYVPGTTQLFNTIHPTGAKVKEDDVIATGVIIGNYEKNTNAFIRFTAEVVNDNFTCGKFILRTWGRATVAGRLVQDSATVNVELADCPDMVEPENKN